MKLELSDEQAKEVCLAYVRSKLDDLKFCQEIIYLVLGRHSRSFYFGTILKSIIPKIVKDHGLSRQNMKDELENLI